MSDRLAISAAFSVLMMAVYVLFGANTLQIDLSATRAGSPVDIAVPAVSLDAGNWLR